MKGSVARLLRWTPRVLAILHILLLSLFSFDVFGLGVGVWQKITALLIHLIPALLLTVVLAIAWRRPFAGGIGYLGLALLFSYVLMGPSDGIGFNLLLVPIILCSILFLFDWFLGMRNNSKI